MPFQVWKQVLAPDTYWVKDPWGQPRPVAFSQDDVRHFARTGKAMVDAGLPIRVPLEHQDYAVPLDDAERRARDVTLNSGWVKDFALDHDQTLWAKLEVTNPQLTPDALRESVKFVSPQIHPEFVDGGGRRWQHCITHLALTPNPIWSGQKPFGSEPAGLEPVALSHALTQFRAPGAPLAGVLRLSLADRVGSNQPPTWTQRLTRLSQPPEEKPMADEPELDLPADDADDDSGPPAKPKKPAAPPAPAAPEGIAAKIEELAAALAEMGIVVEPSDDPEAFVEHCVTAVKSHKATKDIHAPPEGGNPMAGAAATPTPTPTEEPAVVSMSNQVKSLKATNQALQAELADSRLAGLLGVVDGLVKTGRVAPVKAEAWKQALTAKKLSLVAGDDHGIRDAVTQIEVHKELPEGTFWSPEERTTQMSNAVLQTPPAHVTFDKDANGQLTRDRVKQLVEELHTR